MKTVIFCFVLVLSLSSLIGEEPHVHGAAQCQIVVEDTAMEVALILPAINVIGFEHEPTNDQEKKALADAQKKFRGSVGKNLIKVRGTRLAEFALETQDHHAEEEHIEGKAHSDFHLHYHFEKRRDFKETIDFKTLFKKYPGIEEVVWAAVTPNGQRAGEATPKSSGISLK